MKIVTQNFKKKIRTIKYIKTLNNKNKTFLKKINTFLKMFKNDHIDFFQIREIRKNDAIYKQFL